MSMASGIGVAVAEDPPALKHIFFCQLADRWHAYVFLDHAEGRLRLASEIDTYGAYTYQEPPD